MKKQQLKTMQQTRRRMLIKAVHDAAIELARRGEQYLPTPMPDEPVAMVSRIDGVADGPYLDNKRPTPDEIRAFTGDYLDITDPDELWAAYAINTVSGTREAFSGSINSGSAADHGRECPGLGRTAAEAKTCAWVHSHWPGGTTSALVEVSTEVPRRLDFRALSAAKAETGDAGNQRVRHLRARAAHNPQRDA
jgi:hypothetical protein